MGKKMNVQFDLEEQGEIDKVRRLADLVGDDAGDRRVRPASLAKFLVEAVISEEDLAEVLLGLKDREVRVRGKHRVVKDKEFNRLVLERQTH